MGKEPVWLNTTEEITRKEQPTQTYMRRATLQRSLYSNLCLNHFQLLIQPSIFLTLTLDSLGEHISNEGWKVGFFFCFFVFYSGTYKIFIRKQYQLEQLKAVHQPWCAIAHCYWTFGQNIAGNSRGTHRP